MAESQTEPTLELPEQIAARICRCGVIALGTNACPHCGAGWAQVKVPLTTFSRVSVPSIAPVGNDSALHWQSKAGAEETMCGREVKDVRCTLLQDFATCETCKAVAFGYQMGRADERAAAPQKQPTIHAESCDRWVQCGDHVHYEPIVNCSCDAASPAALRDEAEICTCICHNLIKHCARCDDQACRTANAKEWPDVEEVVKLVAARVFPNSENSLAIKELAQGVAAHFAATGPATAITPPSTAANNETLHDAMERDAMIDTMKALEDEINAAWLAIDRGWDIEPRAFFEEEAPKNGFESPLAMAVHYMWKRETKVATNAAAKIADQLIPHLDHAFLLTKGWRDQIASIIERSLSSGS